MHPILKAAVDDAHAEYFEKKRGENRGILAIGQNKYDDNLGMIPRGTRNTLRRIRGERLGELVVGLPVRTGAGAVMGGLLGGLVGNASMGTGVGIGAGAGDTLSRINRLNRVAGYLSSRSKGKRKIKGTVPRRGVYKSDW